MLLGSFHRLTRLAVLAAVLLPIRAAESNAAITPAELATRHRKPIGAALALDGRYLVVGNRRSGTVSLLDTAERKIAREYSVSDRLAALVAVGDGRRFAALDDKRNELVLLRLVETPEDGPRVEVFARAPVADDPAGVCVSADGRLAAVATRWSRSLQIVEMSPDDADLDDKRRREPRSAWPEASPRMIARFDLPFAAREVLFFDDDARVVVSDAFGGGLAVFDLQRDDLRGDFHHVTYYRIDGHALRGLAYEPERREIVFAYQHLDQGLPTTPEAIGQGRLLENRLHRTPLTQIPRTDRTEINRLWPGHYVRLDRPDAAADPQDVILASDERAMVVLGGSNRLAQFPIGAPADTARYAEVGSRPVAAAVDSSRRLAYVVNSLSDTISVVDLGRMQTTASISLGPRPELYPRDRGERIFFDARPSPGGFVSCHSCHVDGHTSGLLADTLADGTYGTPKRILTLQGTSLTDQWGWNGEFRELREQVRRSLECTMHVLPMHAADHDDVAAFLHTLPFPKPALPKPEIPAAGAPIAAANAADAASWQRGESIFTRHRCGQCHVGPLTYTSQPSFDVGVSDERGRTKFNPPSLRGVSQNSRLFHDNRCESIEAVFRDEQHQLDAPLSDEEIAALARYLRSL